MLESTTLVFGEDSTVMLRQAAPECDDLTTFVVPGLVVPGGVPSAGVNYPIPAGVTSHVISHGLGYRPSVEVLSPSGAEIVLPVLHNDLNTLTVYMTPPFGAPGLARLT